MIQFVILTFISIIFCMILFISFDKNKKIFKLYTGAKEEIDQLKKDAYNSDINKEYRNEIERLNNEIKKKKSTSLSKGDKALIPNWPLIYNEGKNEEIRFKATYEVEIIEVSSKTVKVNPISCVCDKSEINNNPMQLKGALDYMKNNWIEIDKVQLILDERHRRDDKLEEILNK